MILNQKLSTWGDENCTVKAPNTSFVNHDQRKKNFFAGLKTSKSIFINHDKKIKSFLCGIRNISFSDFFKWTWKDSRCPFYSLSNRVICPYLYVNPTTSSSQKKKKNDKKPTSSIEPASNFSHVYNFWDFLPCCLKSIWYRPKQKVHNFPFFQSSFIN